MTMANTHHPTSTRPSAVCELAMAIADVRCELGPEWALVVDCGPEVHLVQHDRASTLLEAMGIKSEPPARVVYQGEPVDLSCLPADRRPPADVAGNMYISGGPEALRSVTREAIRRAKHRVRPRRTLWGYGLTAELMRALHEGPTHGLTRDELVTIVGGGPIEVSSTLDLLYLADHGPVEPADRGAMRRDRQGPAMRWLCTCESCMGSRRLLRLGPASSSPKTRRSTPRDR